MAVKATHSSEYSLYFCTFTCFRWLNLFEKTDAYHTVYKWFGYLKETKNINIAAYVIMPNHVHILLNFPIPNFNLNTIIGNGKRFIAYEIIKELKRRNDVKVLNILPKGVTPNEREKGQKHRVF
ncbi:MAG: transposase [Bacteroidetes bacterium]|nr:transposase [Bacteroidota bacterium]MDA1122338.1 transposase [Bacteroidota bacterium]